MCSFVVCVVSLVIRILSVSHMNSNLNMLKYERFKEKANQIYF